MATKNPTEQKMPSLMAQMPGPQSNVQAPSPAKKLLQDAKADQKLRRILRTEPPVHITPDPPKSILRIGRPKDHGKKGLHFDEIVEVLPTLGPKEYSRKPDPNSTFRNLTPMLRNEIRDEVNQYKSAEMEIHPESVDNLCFH